MKISIITINLNNAVGLSNTVNSVINQTYSNIEFIIIDGGSTDESLNIIKESEKRTSYWISEKDNGMYQAMNKGILKSNGEYLLFLNSGDTLSNNEVIKNTVSLLKNEDIVYGNINIMHESHIFRTAIYPDNLNFNYFIQGTLPHQGMFIRKSVFSVVGLYSEELKICSDWKFQLDSVCKHKSSYKHINLTVANFLGGGLSALNENQELIKNEKESVLINEYALFKEDLEMIKEYKILAFYYQDSKRVRLLKKIKFLKKILSGKHIFEYASN